MKKVILTFILIITSIISTNSQVNIIAFKGDVKIRKGVSEEWQTVNLNTKLSLEDAISISTKSSVTLLINNQKKITLPEQTIVEIADLRELSKEELLLKLAMDRILAVPPQERKNDLMPAQSTIIHGEKKADMNTIKSINNKETAIKTLNGARFLFNNKYYGTCALRIKEVLRIIPNIPEATEYKIMAGIALGKIGLYAEALNELYLIKSEDLTSEQKSVLQTNIEELKKKIKE